MKYKKPPVIIISLFSIFLLAAFAIPSGYSNENSIKGLIDSTISDSTNAVYTCPMHPEITSDKPGKCTKCGMELVLQKKENTVTYTCPMHPEVKSDKPGVCPKCGMELISEKKNNDKDGNKNHQNNNHGFMGMGSEMWIIMGAAMIAMMAVILMVNSNHR